MDKSLTILSLIIFLGVLPLQSISQHTYLCPPCGMECDKQTYDSGGICPDPGCNKILKRSQLPSVIWPSINYKTGNIAFTLQSSDESRHQVNILTNKKIRKFSVDGLAPKLSPSESHLLFLREDSIFLLNLKTNSIENISKAVGLLGSATWKSDDELVVASGNFPSTKLVLYHIGSQKQTVLYASKGFHYAPAVSPNGDVAFATFRKGLSVLKKGEVDPVIVHKNGEYASFSPAGDKVAFHALENKRFSIYVCNLDGTEMKKIRAGIEADYELPFWSRDGKTIYFMSNKRHGNWDLFKMNADGTNESLILASEKFKDI